MKHINILKKFFFCAGALVIQCSAFCQQELITNIPSRNTVNLNGKWQYIIDPYETGFYDYRYKERKETDRDAYWNSDVQQNKLDRKEFGFVKKYSLNVPGDWNSQKPELLYYEGTVWYKRSFDYKKKSPLNKVYLYFGAVNYRADVYLNGKKLGMHKGGFTPFNFIIPDSVLRSSGNSLVVKVDNKRYADEIPTLNTDWWNYGGITRDVKLIELPARNSIMDYMIQLNPANSTEVEGWVKINNGASGEKVTVGIPELKIKNEFPVKDGIAKINFPVPSVQLWSPQHPVCYGVTISSSTEKLHEKIGFRTIQAEKKNCS